MPKIVPRKTTRPARTRAEIQQEFAGIQREVETAQAAADPKLEETANLREQEVRQTVDGVSMEGVLQKINGLSLEMTKALSGLGEKLVAEVDLLASLRAAVDLERRELDRLHKIDVAATALDQMVQEYQGRKRALESEIAAQRAAWEEETRNGERERKEQEESLKKQRQRDIDDYEYKKTLERKRAQDAYEEGIKLQERKNKEKQEALEKEWKQRELALKEQEEELGRLRREAQEFPARLKKEVDAAAAQAAKAAQQNFEQQLAMSKKDAEAEKRVFDLQVRALEETVSRQNTHIASLQKQLDEAKTQVQEIAVRAIEGASGARALTHVNQIAMEQAKNRPPA